MELDPEVYRLESSAQVEAKSISIHGNRRLYRCTHRLPQPVNHWDCEKGNPLSDQQGAQYPWLFAVKAPRDAQALAALRSDNRPSDGNPSPRRRPQPGPPWNPVCSRHE